MSTTTSPYPSIHAAFRKEFRKVRDFLHSTNRYDLRKLATRTNVFEDSRYFVDLDDEDATKELDKRNPHYVVTDIGGCELTRVKEDKSSFAIGDGDGMPVTPFDFIWVSTEASGGDDPLIEVITKDGDFRYFSVVRRKLDECMGAGGAGAGGAGAGGAAAGGGAGAAGGAGVGGGDAGAAAATPGGGAEIQYGDLQKEMLLPVRGRVPLLYGGPAGRRRRKRRKGRVARRI